MTARLTSAPVASRPASFDVERVRADFPALHQQVGGRPLVYLDNAATTQKPRAVIDALVRYYERDNANVHRGVHTLSVRATDAYERARSGVQRFVNAAAPEEIVFVRGATEAINLVAQCWGPAHLHPGDEVLITEMEHHSNIVPWQMVCGRTGARLRVAPINDRGELRLDEMRALLGPRTRMVATAHVSNALGTVNPVAEIAAAAHDAGALVLLDGAQAGPHLPIDVRRLGCDFYVLSSHKVYGPTGVGVLYGRRELLAALPPWQGGGEMIASVSFEQTTYADAPARFEAGTPHIAGVVGLGAAIEYLVGLDRVALAAHERELLEYAMAALAAVPGVRLIGTAAEKAAVVSFIVEGAHPHDVGTVLDQRGVAIRTGHHCAQPLMQRYGVPATCRASFGLYNTRAEVDALVAGVREAARLLAI